jgi:hypothetical protein
VVGVDPDPLWPELVPDVVPLDGLVDDGPEVPEDIWACGACELVEVLVAAV